MTAREALIFSEGDVQPGALCVSYQHTLQVGKRRQQTGSLMKGCDGAMFYPSAVTSLGQTCQSAAAVPADDGRLHHRLSPHSVLLLSIISSITTTQRAP